MPIVNVSIAKEILAANPRFALGLLRAKVHVTKDNVELKAQLEGAVKETLDSGQFDLSRIDDVAGIKALRETYTAVGKNANSFKGSNEAFFRRILEGKGIYFINTVVDINNLVSVKSGRSVGSYDLSKLGTDIEFRLGRSGEKYPSTKGRSLKLNNLPLLADEMGPFGSPTSDSDRSLIQEETTDVMTAIFSFDGEGALHEELLELQRLIERYADATGVDIEIINTDAPACELYDPETLATTAVEYGAREPSTAAAAGAGGSGSGGSVSVETRSTPTTPILRIIFGSKLSGAPEPDVESSKGDYADDHAPG